ncbi:MAG: SIMPL domain-containing protein [Lewinellaceae bacterium]|nr:SIMPL domain-containing protein [Lewinellaceae bacterium]
MKNILLMFLLPLSASLTAQTGEKNFIDQPYIEVTGQAEMEITPDQIYLQIVLREQDDKGRTPLATLEKAMLAKLAELGIDIAKDVTVRDFTSDYKLRMLAKNDILLTKYYQVLAHDGTTVEKLFSELEKLGISNVSVARLDHSRLEAFRQEVKIDAIKAARKKAEALTGAIGQGIGKAIYIRELEYAPSYISQVSNVMSYEASAYASESNPEFNNLTLKYAIMVRFALE